MSTWISAKHAEVTELPAAVGLDCQLSTLEDVPEGEVAVMLSEPNWLPGTEVVLHGTPGQLAAYASAVCDEVLRLVSSHTAEREPSLRRRAELLRSLSASVLPPTVPSEVA